MSKKHKWADCIIAWAEGKEIQFYDKYYNRGWVDIDIPTWFEDHQYRIKPESKPEPKPDITKTGRIYLDDANQLCWNEYNYPDNVKFTFDGETGKLKEVKNLYE